MIRFLFLLCFTLPLWASSDSVFEYKTESFVIKENTNFILSSDQIKVSAPNVETFSGAELICPLPCHSSFEGVVLRNKRYFIFKPSGGDWQMIELLDNFGLEGGQSEHHLKLAK